jgi:hypothetical protein
MITSIDNAQAAQEIAQHDLEVSKVPYHLNTPSMPSLGTILGDVNSTMTCLMRLSKTLLDNHRRHRRADRYCTEGDTHHAQRLRRLVPLAELTTLEQLSRSTCARRSELLAMNSQRVGSSGPALKPLDDDSFLRVVLLELASVTGEATFHDPGASSGIDAAQEVEGDLNTLGDSGKVNSPGRKDWTDENLKQVDSVFSTPNEIPGQPKSTRSSAARDLRDQGYQAQPSDTQNAGKARVIGSDSRNRDLQAQLSDTQNASKSRVIKLDSWNDTAESMTISACTRCRVVSLYDPQRRS